MIRIKDHDVIIYDPWIQQGENLRGRVQKVSGV